jgi:hypothetical protein
VDLPCAKNIVEWACWAWPFSRAKVACRLEPRRVTVKAGFDAPQEKPNDSRSHALTNGDLVKVTPGDTVYILPDDGKMNVLVNAKKSKYVIVGVKQAGQ